MLPKENPNCYASPQQRELLLKIAQIEIVQEAFFLTGGTALSVFYLGHRISEDLDFFTTQKKNLKEICLILKRIISPRQTISEHTTFLSYIATGGKVDFVVDPLSFQVKRPQVNLSSRNEEVALTIDTLENICVNKICAVVGRLSAKDVVDLFFLFQKAYDVDKFLLFYEEGRRREALLDDFNYTIEAFEEIQKRAEDILKIMSSTLRKEVPLQNFKSLWKKFEDILKSTIETGLGFA